MNCAFLQKNFELFSNRTVQKNHMITNINSDCGIISIRDPAEILESGFLYEFMYLERDWLSLKTHRILWMLFSIEATSITKKHHIYSICR